MSILDLNKEGLSDHDYHSTLEVHHNAVALGVEELQEYEHPQGLPFWSRTQHYRELAYLARLAEASSVDTPNRAEAFTRLNQRYTNAIAEQAVKEVIVGYMSLRNDSHPYGRQIEQRTIMHVDRAVAPL